MLSYKICIIGIGYVGEQLINIFKDKYQVIGIDINKERINFLKKKFINEKNILLQNNYNNIEEYNVFIISVPTLVCNNEINISALYKVNKKLNLLINPNSIIILESTVYIGATREIFGHFLDKNIYVGFSPERIDPGRKKPNIKNIPKIVSGLNNESLNIINKIYSSVIKKTVTVSSVECAEMCKLYENCFRMINIAYVNEISDMCKNFNINCYEMINASSSKPFGFMPFFPGIGIGGHCIPVNPYYLFKNGNLPLLKLSTDMMKDRPKKKANEIMQKYKNIEKVLLVGIGFKFKEKIITNSPGYELYKNLKYKEILIYDPFVKNLKNNISEIKLLNINIFNLVIVIHPYNINIIKNYEKNGGKVIWYTNN